MRSIQAILAGATLALLALPSGEARASDVTGCIFDAVVNEVTAEPDEAEGGDPEVVLTVTVIAAMGAGHRGPEHAIGCPSVGSVLELAPDNGADVVAAALVEGDQIGLRQLFVRGQRRTPEGVQRVGGSRREFLGRGSHVDAAFYPEDDPGAPPADSGGPALIRVDNAVDLLLALGSDRIIELSPGPYDLNEAIGFLDAAGIEHSHAGGLHIVDIRRLTIRGPGDARHGSTLSLAHLFTGNVTATVITIERSQEVVIEGLAVGHSGDLPCLGDVVAVLDSGAVELRRNFLYGSGSRGLYLQNADGVRLQDSEVTGCSEGAVWVEDSREVRLSRLHVHHNASVDLFLIAGSADVRLLESWVGLNEVAGLLTIQDSTDVAVERSVIRDNTLLTPTLLSEESDSSIVLRDSVTDLDLEGVSVETTGSSPPPEPPGPTPVAGALPAGERPTVDAAIEGEDIQIHVHGLPALSRDGRQVAYAWAHDSSPLGVPHVSLHVQNIQDGSLDAAITVIGLSEAADIWDEAARAELTARLPGRLDAVRELLEATQWIPLTPLPLQNENVWLDGWARLAPTPDEDLTLLAHYDRLMLASPERNIALSAHGRWHPQQAAPVDGECGPDANLPVLTALWAEPDRNLLFLKVSYTGTDACWEPASTYHALPLRSLGEGSSCALQGGTCHAACGPIERNLGSGDCPTDAVCCLALTVPADCELHGGVCLESCDDRAPIPTGWCESGTCCRPDESGD